MLCFFAELCLPNLFILTMALVIKLQPLFTGADLARNFEDYGQLEGEVMEFIVSSIKSDPTCNHVFASGKRVLLSSYFLTV